MNGTPPTAALERRNVRRSILCLALFLTLATTPVQATAEPELRVKVADAALVRPLAAIGAVLSTAAFFVAVVPCWVVGVDERDLAHHMVKRPWYYVHGRELGNFDDTL